MVDQYVYFLFRDNQLIGTYLRRPQVQPGQKCLGILFDRLIIASEETA